VVVCVGRRKPKWLNNAFNTFNHVVEYSVGLDAVFACLADATRRDILTRVAREELSVGQIAKRYDLTFAAVSKHLKILEHAGLVLKRRDGKHQFVHLSPTALRSADDYLEQYRRMWETRLDSLEEYLKTEDVHDRKKRR